MCISWCELTNNNNNNNNGCKMVIVPFMSWGNWPTRVCLELTWHCASLAAGILSSVVEESWSELHGVRRSNEVCQVGSDVIGEWRFSSFSLCLFHELTNYYYGRPIFLIGQAIIFLSCGFFLSIFFSSPNVSGRRLDVYHTSTHGVAPMWI